MFTLYECELVKILCFKYLVEQLCLAASPFPQPFPFAMKFERFNSPRTLPRG